jgi:hypothetical protein
MANAPDDTKPDPAKDTEPQASEPAELQDEMHRVLFDHEMERGMTTTRVKQPRRRGRVVRR